MSQRGNNRGKPSNKAPKRDFDCVSPPSPDMAVTLAGMRKLLKEELLPIDNELKEVRKSLQDTSDKLDEMTKIEKRVAVVEKHQAKIQQDYKDCHQLCHTLSEQVLLLESRSRRNNLKFVSTSNENCNISGENCEDIILSLCASVGLTISTIDIERAHRVGPRNKPNQPILVKFANYKVREQVLAAKTKIREKGVVTTEDFPDEINNRRQMFSSVLKAAYESPKYKAKLVVDKLLLNGKLFSVNELDMLPDELNPHNLTAVTRGNCTAFYSRSSVFSNHFPCAFVMDGTKYSSTEQFIMHQKAKLFWDAESANQIMKSNNPVVAKGVGKRIKGYKAEIWNSSCTDVMKTALKAKFSQNPELASILKKTGNNVLIEANPTDHFWGVGLSIKNLDVFDESKWKGKNILGQLLMELRGIL